MTEDVIEGTVGGSRTGPTKDAEGIVLAVGDRVEVVYMADAPYSYYVGQVGELTLVQDVFPFSQVFVEFPDVEYAGAPLGALSTFSAWVRKVG